MTDTSKAYADALYSLAMDAHNEAATLDALREAAAILRDTPEAMNLLASPSIPKDERLQILSNAFEGMTEPAMGFIHVLVAKGHIRQLNDCIKAYEELHDAAKKLATAYVTSAVALDEAEKKELTMKLEQRLGRTIRLVCSVDPSLLGGLVVQVDGRIIDGSLKHRLHEIKEVMNR